MNISKWGSLWALATGGFVGLATYILEAVNKWLATLDQSKLAEVAKIVNAVSSALQILLSTFLPAKYRMAATTTIDALNGLASALSDGTLTQEELDRQIALIEAAIAAWKEIG